jgi:membrane protein
MATIARSTDRVEGQNDWAYWRRIGGGTLQILLHPDTAPRCAGTAFYGFLSLFPAIATIVFIYGLVADTHLLIDTVQTLTFILPAAALELVSQQLLTIVTQPPVTLGIGLLISIPLALWSGSRGIDALLYAMSQVRGEPPKRHFLTSVAIAVAMTIAGSVVLVVALLTVAGLPALTHLLPFPSRAELVVLGIRWPILLGIAVVVIGALYRWGPDRHPRRWKYIWPGALLASILWVFAGVVFSIYVENWGNFEASFGSVSAAVVLLLWMYNSAQIFVLGAAFNAQIEKADAPAKPVKQRRAPARSQRKPSARKRRATA